MIEINRRNPTNGSSVRRAAREIRTQSYVDTLRSIPTAMEQIYDVPAITRRAFNTEWNFYNIYLTIVRLKTIIVVHVEIDEPSATTR